MKTRSVLKATFCFLALGLPLTGWLFAAELSTDFPKPPPPLDLAPRMGRTFNNHAVFQQNMPIPVWGWTLPGADCFRFFRPAETRRHRRSRRAI